MPMAILCWVPAPAQIAAAIAMTRAAHTTAFGPPSQFSSGTTARQASAPPMRSVPYNCVTHLLARANTTENSSPVKKKGAPAAR